jgi:hypothetical protein
LGVELLGDGAGVERFGGGAEVNTGGVQFVHEGGQVADAAAEPVETVDQQQVVASCPGGGQRVGQAGPVEGGAGDVVGEGGRDAPAGL